MVVIPNISGSLGKLNDVPISSWSSVTDRGVRNTVSNSSLSRDRNHNRATISVKGTRPNHH